MRMMAASRCLVYAIGFCQVRLLRQVAVVPGFSLLRWEGSIAGSLPSWRCRRALSTGSSITVRSFARSCLKMRGSCPVVLLSGTRTTCTLWPRWTCGRMPGARFWIAMGFPCRGMISLLGKDLLPRSARKPPRRTSICGGWWSVWKALALVPVALVTTACLSRRPLSASSLLNGTASRCSGRSCSLRPRFTSAARRTAASRRGRRLRKRAARRSG